MRRERERERERERVLKLLTWGEMPGQFNCKWWGVWLWRRPILTVHIINFFYYLHKNKHGAKVWINHHRITPNYHNVWLILNYQNMTVPCFVCMQCMIFTCAHIQDQNVHNVVALSLIYLSCHCFKIGDGIMTNKGSVCTAYNDLHSNQRAAVHELYGWSNNIVHKL